MKCPKCGALNESTSFNCNRCNYNLSQEGAYAHVTMEEDAVTESDELYKAAIGKKSQSYYLQKFSRFDEKGGIGFSWHWPAFFITFFWLIYRKMWLIALVYFFAPIFLIILIAIFSIQLGDVGEMVLLISYFSIWALLIFLSPLYANALYYKKTKRLIQRVSARESGKEDIYRELSRKGGTSVGVGFAVFFVGFLLLSFIGILASVAIPAYQAYTLRAEVTYAEKLTRSASLEIEKYIYQYEDIPPTLKL